MENVSFTLLELNAEVISMIEKIRFNAYGIDDAEFISSFYLNALNDGQYVAYGAFYDNKLIGACYVSKSYNSLFIEQLFILKKFQRSGLHLGSGLLKYVLSQKDYIETSFASTFDYSYLDSVNDATSLYESMGYRQSKNLLMRKRLR